MIHLAMFTSNELLTWTRFMLVNMFVVGCLFGATLFRRFVSKALVDLGVTVLLYGGVVGQYG